MYYSQHACFISWLNCTLTKYYGDRIVPSIVHSHDNSGMLIVIHLFTSSNNKSDVRVVTAMNS